MADDQPAGAAVQENANGEAKPMSKRAMKKAAKNKGKEKKVKDPNHGVPKGEKKKKVCHDSKFQASPNLMNNRLKRKSLQNLFL